MSTSGNVDTAIRKAPVIIRQIPVFAIATTTDLTGGIFIAGTNKGFQFIYWSGEKTAFFISVKNPCNSNLNLVKF